MGIFDVAQDNNTQRTVSVLSDEQGDYQIAGLPTATYNIQTKSVGLKADAQRGVAIATDQHISFHFKLENSAVGWSELATYQGRKLLPKTLEHQLTHQDPCLVPVSSPVPQTYANTVGPNGDQWFTSFHANGVIARVSNDGMLTKFQPPTNGKPQRLDLDADGNVSFSERQGNKIEKLYPSSGEIKEYALIGPKASPYAIGVGKVHMIWYSSHEQDTVNRLKPETGEVTEYPDPHSEISIREFFLDKKGRMWYARHVSHADTPPLQFRYRFEPGLCDEAVNGIVVFRADGDRI